MCVRRELYKYLLNKMACLDMKCVQRQELMPVKLKISDVENVC
jgi:hypothetical protein